jgi:hypothetical protein
MDVMDVTRPESFACASGRLEMKVDLNVDTMKTDVSERTSTMNAQWGHKQVDAGEHPISSL